MRRACENTLLGGKTFDGDMAAGGRTARSAGWGLRPCGGDHRLGAEGGDDPLHVVGQHVEAHLGADPFEGAGEEVGCSHPDALPAHRVTQVPA